MRRIAYLLILLLTLSTLPLALAEEEYEEFGEDFDNAIDTIEKSAKKIQDLIKKYEEKKLDVVKAEDVTIVDQDGNGVSCMFEPYYTNYHAAEMTTDANGKHTGNYNHGDRWPGGVISARISGCPCKIVEIDHKFSYPGMDEHINRIKAVISDEIGDYAEGKAKEGAKKAVEKAFEGAGAGKLAGPFLWGVGVGADLGAPVGQFLTDEINKILEQNLKHRELEHQLGDSKVPRGGRRIKARWNIPVVEWFRTDPVLKNIWNIEVRCWDGEPLPLHETTWEDYELVKKDTPQLYTPIDQVKKEQEDQAEQDRLEQEQREKEERERKAREEQERRDREAREEEERKKRAEEKAKLEAAAREEAQQCKICDPIRNEIADVEKQIAEKEAAMDGLDQAVSDAESDLSDAEKDLSDAQKALDRFNNPQSSASSGDRTVTSTDLAVDREVARDAWSRYRNGDITAEQLESEWANYDDAAREEAKERVKQRLEDAVKNAKEAKENAQKALNDAKSKRSTARQSLANLKKYLEDLFGKLEECIKLCKKYALDIAAGSLVSPEDLIAHEDFKNPPKEEPTQATTAAQPLHQLDDCDRYILYLEKYKTTPDRYEKMDASDREVQGISENAHRAIEQYRKNCDGLSATGSTGTTGSTGSTTGTTGGGTTTITPPPAKTCPEICADHGMDVNPTDWTGYILDELNSNGVCKKSASLSIPGTLSGGGCTCYSPVPPGISISSETLVCKNTQCGDVQCGSSTECSCGDNCVVTVSCNWGGWKKVGDWAYIPTTSS